MMKKKNKSLIIEDRIKLAEVYKVDANCGLTSEQVLKRINNGLSNYCKKEKKGFLKIIFKNVFNFLNLILFSCGAIIFYIGLYKRLFFLLSSIFNIIINLLRDIKLQIVLNSLTFTKQKKTKVIRNGKIENIFFDDLVLSDVVILESGDTIPSDSKIIEGNVYIDESFLTGEKKSVFKKKGDLLFKETLVVNGSCKVEIVKVGFANYVCKLEEEIAFFNRAKGTIFSKIVKLLKIMLIVIFFIISIEVLIMLFKQNVCVSVLDSIVSSLLLMISTGVFLLFSIVLILWSIRLMKNNIFVNEIFAIENIVSMDVLCLDKTGTITSSDMDYKGVVPLGAESSEKELEEILSFFINDDNDKNNLTLKAIKKKINNKNNSNIKRYISFNSKNKYSAVFVDNYIYVLGAMNFVNIVNFDEAEKIVNEYENKGYRVLTLSKSSNCDINSDKLPNDLKIIGIILFSEVINDNVKETIEYLTKNKIKINIISGDSEVYLRCILKNIGLVDDFKVVDLSKKDDSEVRKFVNLNYNVFARTTPNQKKIIIEELKQNHSVTMIGDGANDLLALKKANCSISMPNGYDITKKISNFVLLNSSFKNIIFLINESNIVFKNVRSMYSLFFVKIMSMMLISTIYIFFSLFFNKFFPLNVNNLMPWEMLISGIGAILVSFDKTTDNRKIDTTKFVSDILKYSFLSSILQILIFFSSFLIHVSAPNLLTYRGSIDLAIIMMSFNNIFIMYFLCCRPLNKIRIFNLSITTIFMILFFAADYFIFFNKLNISILDISYKELNLYSFLILSVITVFLCFIYTLFLKYLKKEK